jgi:hypothetical protein
MGRKNLLFIHIIACMFILSCGNSIENESQSTLANTNAGNNKIYFSCKVNGSPLSDNTDGGILDPITNMLQASGENETYTVGIRIPLTLKDGETCTGCKGFVHEKIKEEGGLGRRKIYELTQNFSVTLNSRKKGYAAGTFSFTVKLKEESDKTITVTDGKFAMSIDNE